MLLTGAVTVTLSAANTYVGGTTITSGATFDIGNAQAAGSGAITFAASSSDTLKIESGDAPANVIAGSAGDTIDLAGVGLETTITPGTANAYAFSGGSDPNSAVTLHFDPAQDFSGVLFSLATDGNGGTNVTLTPERAPIIANLQASQTLDDKQTVNPFASVTLTDPDAGQTETITVTLTANGVASDANGTLSGLSKTGAGTYQLVGSSGSGIAALQSALRAVVFTPTQNEVAPASSVPTNLSLSVNDGLKSASASSALTVTSVDDTPVISGTVATRRSGDATIHPFAAAKITHPDSAQRIA